MKNCINHPDICHVGLAKGRFQAWTSGSGSRFRGVELALEDSPGSSSDPVIVLIQIPIQWLKIFFKLFIKEKLVCDAENNIDIEPHQLFQIA